MQQEKIKETVQAMTIQHTDLKRDTYQANNSSTDIAIYIIISCVVGLVKYVVDSRKNKVKMYFIDALARSAVSGISGYVAYNICMYYESTVNTLSVALVVAAWLGIEFLNVLSSGLLDRLKSSVILMFGGTINSNKDENK